MATEAQINRASEEQIASLQANADFINKNLRSVLRRYLREINSAIDRRVGDIPALTRIGDQLALANQLQDILIDAGLEDLIDDYIKEFAEVEIKALEYFRLFDLDDSLAGVDIDSLDALVRFHETTLRQLTDQRLVKPFQNAIFQANLGGRTVDQVRAEIGALTEKYQITTAAGREFTDAQIETLVRDGFVRYDRQVREEKAADLGLEIFLYSGPLDSNTRPACRRMLTINRHGVPGMLYKDEITTDLHPELSEDPLIAGGGYNCRHNWVPVTTEYAVSQGFQVR